LLDSVDANVAGDATVRAHDDAGIVSIGGGFGVVGGTGVGASLGFNQIDGTTRAAVPGSDLDIDGALLVSADNDKPLPAPAAPPAAGQPTATASPLGINLITNEAPAEILDTTLTSAASVTVAAQDDSNIQSIGGALGIGLQGSGFGGALGWNSVFADVTARVE